MPLYSCNFCEAQAIMLCYTALGNPYEQAPSLSTLYDPLPLLAKTIHRVEPIENPENSFCAGVQNMNVLNIAHSRALSKRNK